MRVKYGVRLPVLVVCLVDWNAAEDGHCTARLQSKDLVWSALHFPRPAFPGNLCSAKFCIRHAVILLLSFALCWFSPEISSLLLAFPGNTGRCSYMCKAGFLRHFSGVNLLISRILSISSINDHRCPAGFLSLSV